MTSEYAQTIATAVDGGIKKVNQRRHKRRKEAREKERKKMGVRLERG